MSHALPRLFLVSPLMDETGARDAVSAALEALAQVEIAALLLRGGALPGGDPPSLLGPVITAAQGRDIAVLLEDRPDLVAATGADGVHLTLTEKGRSPIRDLGRRFGDNVILGAGCGTSRHLAMTAGEQGADYVAFGGATAGAPEPDLVAWWEAVMTPPQVALGAADVQEARRLAGAGADFLGLPPGFWLEDRDPAARLLGLLDGLAQGT